MDNYTLVDTTCILVAKRNSGKSCLLKYLVEAEKNKFKRIFVICPTERVNNFYSDLVDDDCIFDEYNEKWAEELINKLSEVNANKSKKDMQHVLLIMDDCIADINFRTSSSIKKIFVRARHCGLGIILTTQYLLSISTIMRTNADWILVGQQNKASLDILCEEYQSTNIDKNEFIKIYNKATKDYNFMVISNNSSKTDDLNEIYGIVRCPENYIRKNIK
jgi:hypothetical protein